MISPLLTRRTTLQWQLILTTAFKLETLVTRGFERLVASNILPEPSGFANKPEKESDRSTRKPRRSRGANSLLPNSTAPGSLQKHINAWKKVGCSSKMVKWLDEGVPLPILTTPDLLRIPNHMMMPVQEAFIDKEILLWLQEKAISLLHSRKGLLLSPLGTVPKKNGKLRMIYDEWYINMFLDTPLQVWDNWVGFHGKGIT